MLGRLLQHHFNALPLMVWAVRVGLRRETALGLARWWERRLHPAFSRLGTHRNPPRTRDSARASIRSTIFR